MATLRILRDRSDHSKSINSLLKSLRAGVPELRHLIDASSGEWTTQRPRAQSKCWPTANQSLPEDEEEPRLPIILATNTTKTRVGSAVVLKKFNNNVATLFVDTRPPTEKAGG